MPTGLFTDRERMPAPNEVLQALGARSKLWQDFANYVADRYSIPPEWRYGGKSWFVWYRKSGKTLVTLYPQAKGFIAQVVLGRDQVTKALELKLGKNVGTILRETPQLHDGRWLFIRVKTAKDVSDIEQLMAIKRRPLPAKPKIAQKTRREPK